MPKLSNQDQNFDATFSVLLGTVQCAEGVRDPRAFCKCVYDHQAKGHQLPTLEQTNKSKF